MDLIDNLNQMRNLYAKYGGKLLIPGGVGKEKARWDALSSDYAKIRERFNNPGNMVTLSEQELVLKNAVPFTLWQKANASPEKVDYLLNEFMNDIRRSTNNLLESSGIDHYYKGVPPIEEHGGIQKPKSGPGALPELTPEEDKPKAAERPGARRKARGFWWESDGKGWRKAEPAN